MREEIAMGVEMMLKGAGIGAETVAAVRAVIEADGMATTTVACRTLGVNAWTLRRVCARERVRRVPRPGRCGALVDLAHLRRLTDEGRLVCGRFAGVGAGARG